MKKPILILLSLFSFSSPSVFGDNYNFFAPELDFTLSDFCYSQPDVQYKEGVYYFPNEEVGITAESICVLKDANGQYASKGKLKQGKFDGNWSFWRPNSKKWAEGNYIIGKQNDLWTYWYENGQKWAEENYKEGKKDDKSTFWNESGLKVSEENYKEGKKDGKSTFWNLSGEIKSEANWKDDECISGDCPD